MNNLKKTVFILFIFGIALFTNYTFATSMTKEDKQNLEEKAKELLEDKEIDVVKIITEYKELSKEFSNDEIADFIEENKEKLEEKGINSNVISAGTEALRTMKQDTLTDILENDIDIEKVKENVENGHNASELIEDVSNNLTTKQKVKIALKLIYSNKYVKICLIILGICMIYSIILRWIIFKKAKKHGFAAIIPIYRDITYFKICNISPWVILLFLIPIIGPLILLVIRIVSRFKLAYSFGKKAGFGFGLWILPLVFESIIAFSKKISYIEN